MTQRDLNRSVAQSTGEDLCVIEARGFGAFDPSMPEWDRDFPLIDWDGLELRQISLFPDRQRRHAIA